MFSSDLLRWNAVFEDKARALYPSVVDPSHDVLHIRRVVEAARLLGASEGADMNVVLPAAWFHDFVTIAKDDPRRKQASRLSAEAATAYLKDIGYPEHYLPAIAHAIAAHSFSAGIPPETIEAKIVQDADRLDALGAVGIARLFTTNGRMGTPYYHEGEPLPETRAADDHAYAIDHFYVKLFRLPGMMHTASAKAEAERRGAFMREYLRQLGLDIGAMSAISAVA
jgi:uncharacterized protein